MPFFPLFSLRCDSVTPPRIHMHRTAAAAKNYFQFQFNYPQKKWSHLHDIPIAYSINSSRSIFAFFILFNKKTRARGPYARNLYCDLKAFGHYAKFKAPLLKTIFIFIINKKIMVLCWTSGFYWPLKKFGGKNIKRNKSGWRWQSHVFLLPFLSYFEASLFFHFTSKSFFTRLLRFL